MKLYENIPWCKMIHIERLKLHHQFLIGIVFSIHPVFPTKQRNIIFTQCVIKASRVQQFKSYRILSTKILPHFAHTHTHTFEFVFRQYSTQVDSILFNKYLWFSRFQVDIAKDDCVFGELVASLVHMPIDQNHCSRYMPPAFTKQLDEAQKHKKYP